MAKQLTELAMTAAISAGATGEDWRVNRRLSMALAFVVNAIQRHAIARDAAKANDLKDLPGIEQIVSAVAMLAERADLEVSPFVAAWDPAISSVDRDGRSIDEEAVDGLSRAMSAQMADAIGGGSSSREAVAKGFAKAMDSYMSSPPVGSGTFADLRAWLTLQVLKDVDQFDRSDMTVDYLRPLVRWAAENRAVVSTLNYDECIETAAGHESVQVDLAVEKWATTGLLGEPLDEESLRLLKLHGSVNWCFVRGTGFSLNRPPDEWPYEEYEPGIVYGQRGKLRPKGPFLQLLEAFRTELERSTKLLVIGYSFGDDHINTLVRSWLKRNDSRRMLVVDPCIPKYSQNPYDGFEYEYNMSLGLSPDIRRAMWHEFGPRPSDEPRDATRPDGQVQEPRPPIPSQFYIARCSTKDFLTKLENEGTSAAAMGRLFAGHKNDPHTLDAWVNPKPRLVES